jgi:hypothetical protein
MPRDRRPGTLCSISPYRIAASYFPQPREGAFMLTEVGRAGARRVGSAYRIVAVRELPRSPRHPGMRRYALGCVREDPSNVPDDALTFSLTWDHRARSAS